MLERKQRQRIEQNLRVLPIVVFNPRRDDWDSDWNKTKHHPLLNQQINWELDNLEDSDFIVFHFEGGTISPVTLLELGIFSKSKKIFVHCPEDYFRVENVVQVCKRYEIPVVNSVAELANEVLIKMYK